MVATRCDLTAPRCTTKAQQVRAHGSRGGVFVDHRPPRNAPPSKFYVCFPAFHTHTHFCSGTSIEQALLLNIKMALQCIIHTKRQQNKNPKRRMEGISYIPSLPSSQVPFWMHSSDSPVLRLAGRHAGNLEISAFSGKMTMQRQVRRGDQP